MGAPAWPDCAFSTASMARVRMVLIARQSISVADAGVVALEGVCRSMVGRFRVAGRRTAGRRAATPSRADQPTGARAQEFPPGGAVQHTHDADGPIDADAAVTGRRRERCTLQTQLYSKAEGLRWRLPWESPWRSSTGEVSAARARSSTGGAVGRTNLRRWTD